MAFTYDAAGNLLTATDSRTGTITRTYDALNRLVTETTPQGAIAYRYDEAGRRHQLQASGQPPVTYGYDANSRLTAIVQGPQTVGLEYDAASRRTLLTLPNGVATEYHYDEASRLVAQVYRNALGVLGDLTYQYDGTGNRTGTGGSWARTLLPAGVPTAEYDAANAQLAFGAMTQTFDPNGNLETQTDAAGTTSYTWDARNRLVAINGPTVNASFAYDALGRRITKTVNGVLTAFLYDGLDAVAEQGAEGDVSYLRTLAIDEALVRSDSAGPSAYLADILGSTVALADGTGAASTTYAYAPFGETGASGAPSLNAAQYTGRENDGTGLYYYRARYYDSMRGRFLSEDPIGLAGGDANLYVYAHGNPQTFIDPAGQQVNAPSSPRPINLPVPDIGREMRRRGIASVATELAGAVAEGTLPSGSVREGLLIAAGAAEAASGLAVTVTAITTGLTGAAVAPLQPGLGALLIGGSLLGATIGAEQIASGYSRYQRAMDERYARQQAEEVERLRKIRSARQVVEACPSVAR